MVADPRAVPDSGLDELRRQAEALTARIAANAVAETELRRSRQLLDALLDHTDVLIYAKDLHGRFVLANAAMERAVGQEAGAMIGRTGAEVFPRSSDDMFGRNDSQTPESGSWLVFQEELMLADGCAHTYRSTKFPLVDDGGRVYAVAGVSTDITELTTVRAEMIESGRRFRALFDHSPVAIGLSDEHGLWVEANAAFGRLLGVDPSRMVGHSALEYAHPDDHGVIADSEMRQLASADRVMRVEMRLRRPDGSYRWAWVNVTPAPGPNGEQWTLAVAEDITERKETETALRRSEAELAAIAAVARCVQSGTDPRPVVVASVRSLSGATTVGLLEPSDSATLIVTCGDGAELGLGHARGSTADLVRRSGQAVLLPSLPTADGPTRTGHAGQDGGSALWQPVVVEGEVIAVLNVVWPGQVTGMGDPAVRSVRVLADEAGASLHAMQLRTELERSATTDPLTGALNRRAFLDRLEVLMHRAGTTAKPLTIALVDLDNFKAYNDAFGHAAGDVLLCEFASAVLGQLRAPDLFARWGGEEFIVALTDCDADQAPPILHRIRGAVPGAQTGSIGYTTWRPTEPMHSCIVRADTAMYRAKNAGRDRLVAG